MCYVSHSYPDNSLSNNSSSYTKSKTKISVREACHFGFHDKETLILYLNAVGKQSKIRECTSRDARFVQNSPCAFYGQTAHLGASSSPVFF